MNKQTPTPKLPWTDDPRKGFYIDDNALYLLWCLSEELLSPTKEKGKGHLPSSGNIIYLNPPEWDLFDTIEFLLKAAEEYDLTTSTPTTLIDLIKELYEKPLWDSKGQPLKGHEKEVEQYIKDSQAYDAYLKKHKIDRYDLPFDKEVLSKMPHSPKIYQGGYKWALDKIAQDPKDPESQLLQRLLDNEFSVADLKEAIKRSKKPVPHHTNPNFEPALAAKLYRDIVTYAEIQVSGSQQLIDDLNTYLIQFIEGKLLINPRDKSIGRTLVKSSRNVLKFPRQKDILLAELKSSENDYGSKFTFENTLYDDTPLLDDAESLRERYAKKEFLFIHTLLAFERLECFNIRFLGTNWHYSEKEPPRFRARLELLLPIYPLLGKEPQDFKNLSFDPDKSRLYIQGKPIKILKMSDQYHALRIIFEIPEDIGQEWFFSEISERVDKAKAADRKKRYYNALYQVGLKAAREGFPDLFIKTRQSAQINPKYLS